VDFDEVITTWLTQKSPSPKSERGIFTYFLKTPLKNFPMLYVTLNVTHIGQIPKRKKVKTTFLYHGKLAGTMGQLTPSPSYSLMPQTLTDSFIIVEVYYPKK
jgi:hypothetical protein